MSTAAATPWQWAWREGVAPQLSTAGLKALQKALECDDPALIQGQNLLPPPLQSHESDLVIAACAICFTAWKGDYQGCAPVAKVDLRFAEVCHEAGQLLREPGAVHFFLIQYDSWTREEMRRSLLQEVGLALAGRQHELALPEEAKPPKKLAPSKGKETRARKKKTS